MVSTLENNSARQIFYRNWKIRNFSWQDYFLRGLLSVLKAFPLLCRKASGNVDALSQDWIVDQMAIAFLITITKFLWLKVRTRKLEVTGFDEVSLNWVEPVWNNVSKSSFRNPHYLEIKITVWLSSFSEVRRVSWAIFPSITMFITQYFAPGA